MTQLIVALDCDALRAGMIFSRLKRELNLTWFKIGTGTLLEHSGMILVENMVRDGVDLFVDTKLYDTRDTVERVARRAFDLGARFLTVHATPSMLEAAMRAKSPIPPPPPRPRQPAQTSSWSAARSTTRRTRLRRRAPSWRN